VDLAGDGGAGLREVRAGFFAGVFSATACTTGCGAGAAAGAGAGAGVGFGASGTHVPGVVDDSC
jgi:hypothetical protein